MEGGTVSIRRSGIQSNIRITGPGGEWTIQVNADALLDAAQEAFAEANQFVDSAAKAEASRTKWPWPNDPTTRDVVDSGRLRSSITAEPEPQAPGGLDVAWLHTVSVAYAAPVLLGYRQKTAAGIKTYPARNIYLVPVRDRMQRVFTGAYLRRLQALPRGEA
jgi:hypothetical protein